jgi:hypothetical protein
MMWKIAGRELKPHTKLHPSPSFQQPKERRGGSLVEEDFINGQEWSPYRYARNFQWLIGHPYQKRTRPKLARIATEACAQSRMVRING